MPFTITCPACQTTSPCPDQFAGRKVKCKKCGHPFLATKPGADDDIVDDVEFVDDAEVVDEPAPKAKPKPKAPPPRVEASPAKKKSASRRGEDDEDFDDDDDVPVPKKKKKAAPEPVSISPMVYILMAVVGLVLLGGGSGLAYYAIKNDRKEPTQTAVVPPPPGGATPKGQPGPPGPGPAANDPNTAGWIEKSDPTAGYRVKFPIEPQTQTRRQPNPMGGFINLNVYMATALPEIFIATGGRIPAGADGNADALLDAAANEGARAGGQAAGLTEKSRSSLTIKGFPARQVEYTLTEQGQRIEMVGWFILAKGRMISLVVMGPTMTPDSPRAKSFLNSLQVD